MVESWAAVQLSLTPFRKIGIIDDGSHFFGFAGGEGPRTQILKPTDKVLTIPVSFSCGPNLAI